MTGQVSTATVRPTSLADARDAMLDTAGPLLFRGGGTKLSWGAPPRDDSIVVETGAMAELRTHDAADATASVQSGMPLHVLQRRLADAGQWLAIDPPGLDDGVTVGGVFAADDAGPSRLRYGTMRDLVIGATFVLSDGTVGRTGGFVIKNVAGYDLARLLCGSLGTLALVAELVVRVHPLLDAHATVRAPADVRRAARMASAIADEPLEPIAVEWAEEAVWVRVGGHPDAVRAQIERIGALLGRDADVVAEDDEPATWRRLTDALAGRDGQTVIRGACLPDQVPASVDALHAVADAAGVAAEVSAHLPLGLVTARLSGDDAGGHADCVTRWRRHLRAAGGHATVRRRRAGVADLVDPWGPPPSAVALMRQVKQALDPVGRCAPGRYVGGI